MKGSYLEIAVANWVDTRAMLHHLVEIFASVYQHHHASLRVHFILEFLRLLTGSVQEPCSRFELVECQRVQNPFNSDNITLQFETPLSDMDLINAVLIIHLHVKKPHHNRTGRASTRPSDDTNNRPFYILADDTMPLLRQRVKYTDPTAEPLGFAVLSPQAQERVRRRHTHQHPKGGQSKYYWQKLALWDSLKGRRVRGEALALTEELWSRSTTEEEANSRSGNPLLLPSNPSYDQQHGKQEGFFGFSLLWEDQMVGGDDDSTFAAELEQARKERDADLSSSKNGKTSRSNNARERKSTRRKKTKRVGHREIRELLKDGKKIKAIYRRKEQRVSYPPIPLLWFS